MIFMQLRALVLENSVVSLVMFIVVSVISFMVLLFNVGMRLFGRWRNWLREDPLQVAQA